MELARWQPCSFHCMFQPKPASGTEHSYHLNIHIIMEFDSDSDETPVCVAIVWSELIVATALGVQVVVYQRSKLLGVPKPFLEFMNYVNGTGGHLRVLSNSSRCFAGLPQSREHSRTMGWKQLGQTSKETRCTTAC